MKKITKLLTALVFAASALVMSGCADDEIKDRLGPNNVWCTFREDPNKTYNNDSKITYYFKYVESTNTLSIAVVPAPESTLASAFKAAVNGTSGSNKVGYYLKEYQDGQTVTGAEDENDNSGESFKNMSQAKWEVFYVAKLTKSSLPANSEAVSFEKIKADITNFSLKEAILDALLNSLGL